MSAAVSEPEPEPAVSARAITMRGPWGPVYGPIDLDVDSGGVTALIHPAGTGRTALLLTLAGRMRPISGTVTVFGHSDARKIFAVSALANIDQLDKIAESVTVRDLITEQLRWDAPWYRFIGQASATDLADICASTFGDVALPDLGAYFDQIGELAQVLLRIALANTGTPPLLVVGDLDGITDDGNRAVVLERLTALGEDQTVITTSANAVPGARAQISMES
ncbi:ATP-binding cassette domain-containing protein [Mycolicibacterium frederiksbergense]|uniref:ATP-binding cassette domain-containing protein n=1 Tax=Mycolicibacterium frederiksbergense TaxID=117567 RepID=UPI00355653B6